MFLNPERVKNRKFVDYNTYLIDNVKGELTEEEARIVTAKFLMNNLGLTWSLLTGGELAPYQEVILKGFFNNNFNMFVGGRGTAKSMGCAMFCILYLIFNPGTKIIIAGPTFRTARLIFGKIKEIADGEGATLLNQCLGELKRGNDEWVWNISKGTLIAVPLNNEKIRGYRADILIIDEANYVSRDLIETVLMPFLTANTNAAEQMRQKTIEDRLVSQGVIKDSERKVFKNKKKMIMLSSAGYTFQYLYELYKKWLENIAEETTERDASHFVAQIAWDVVPEEIMNKTIIDEAREAQGENSPSFLMEYCAQFSDGSDSYFSAKKMEECTYKKGELPHTLIKGDKDKKYILSIDCKWADSPSSDYFAFAILEIDEDTKTCTKVHGYQGLGDLTEHIKYLVYILKCFNIVLAIGDSTGLDTFLSAVRSSSEFESEKLSLEYLEFDTMLEGEEYIQELIKVRKLWNKEAGRILIRQTPSANYNNRANQELQKCIERRKIMFASATESHDDFFNAEQAKSIPKEYIYIGERKDWNVLDLIQSQDMIIKDTKKQCSLIEQDGTKFDLPRSMRTSKAKNKPRKDNYSCLVLANWAAKVYWDLASAPEKQVTQMYIPTSFNVR